MLPQSSSSTSTTRTTDIDNNLLNQRNNNNLLNNNLTTNNNAAPFSSSSLGTTSNPHTSSHPSTLHTTNAPLSSSSSLTSNKGDTNDMSAPSFGKAGLYTAAAAAAASSASAYGSSSSGSLSSSSIGANNAAINTNNLTQSAAVRDPLTLADIENRGLNAGGLGHSGVGTSATREVLDTLKNKENSVLLGAAREINEIEQKVNAERRGVLNDNSGKIAAVHRENEAKIAQLKKEEAEKVAQLQNQQQQHLSGTSPQDKKIHDIALHAKEQLDQVRLHEAGAAQNLTAAEQLRAMAGERETLAEKQAREAEMARVAASSIHAPLTGKAATTHTGTTHTAPISGHTDKSHTTTAPASGGIMNKITHMFSGSNSSTASSSTATMQSSSSSTLGTSSVGLMPQSNIASHTTTTTTTPAPFSSMSSSSSSTHSGQSVYNNNLSGSSGVFDADNKLSSTHRPVFADSSSASTLQSANTSSLNTTPSIVHQQTNTTSSKYTTGA